MEGSEASEQRLFQGTLCGFGFAGKFERMPKDFTRAAVDYRCEDAPAVVIAENISKVSRPAFVGCFGDRLIGFDTRTTPGVTLGKGRMESGSMKAAGVSRL